MGGVWKLVVAGREIGTTAEHPFYVKDKGWLEAHKLEKGNQLATLDGQWVTVNEVFDTGHLEVVYNLRIGDYHTYFVGCEEWGFSVWAHNALCAEQVVQQLERAGITEINGVKVTADHLVVKGIVEADADPAKGSAVAKQVLKDAKITNTQAKDAVKLLNEADAAAPVVTGGVRQRPLSEFDLSQQRRLEAKLSDIEHVRNGQPAPSGQWDARDGIPFENREGLLPPSTKGYTEYRVPGSDGKPSGARIVINEDNGNVYYSQHYSDDNTGFTQIIGLKNQFIK